MRGVPEQQRANRAIPALFQDEHANNGTQSGLGAGAHIPSSSPRAPRKQEVGGAVSAQQQQQQLGHGQSGDATCLLHTETARLPSSIQRPSPRVLASLCTAAMATPREYITNEMIPCERVATSTKRNRTFRYKRNKKNKKKKEERHAQVVYVPTAPANKPRLRINPVHGRYVELYVVAAVRVRPAMLDIFSIASLA